MAPLSPSAYRIAKGGADIVPLVALKNPLKSLKRLQERGFSLVTTSSHGGTSLYQCKFQERTIIAMGSEAEGVSKQLFSAASMKIQIPGTGLVESLNVSVATSLCLGEYYRSYHG